MNKTDAKKFIKEAVKKVAAAGFIMEDADVVTLAILRNSKVFK